MAMVSVDGRIVNSLLQMNIPLGTVVTVQSLLVTLCYRFVVQNNSSVTLMIIKTRFIQKQVYCLRWDDYRSEGLREE